MKLTTVLLKEYFLVMAEQKVYNRTHCSQWYRFMQTYLPRYLNGEEIEVWFLISDMYCLQL